MTRHRNPSKQARLALSCLYSAAPEGRYGYEICKATGLKSGTLYPILMRLSDNGCLESEWVASELPGRPQRRIYRLSVKGCALALSLESEPAEAPAGATLTNGAT